MFHWLVLLSLFVSNHSGVSAVTLDASLLSQLGYNNESSFIGIGYYHDITDIDPNAFKGYTKVTQLIISTNDQLIRIDLESFKYLINLQVLSLDIRAMTQLTNSKKITFPSLQSFALSYFKLDSLDSNVINAMPNLLAFVSWGIYRQSGMLKPNQLSSWKRLTTLIITAQNQTSLTKEHFNGLNSLVFLDLKDNNLKTIEVHSLLTLPNVFDINFGHNELRSFEYLQIPPKVNTLNLESNQMNYFMLSRTMGVIRKLFINNNQFRSFKSMDFTFLANLTDLSLSDNPHAYPNEISGHMKPLVNLNYIGLSNLSISAIDSNFFKQNTKLTFIDLSNNKISVLPYNTFSHLKDLYSLKLSFNQISVLDNRTFIGLNNLLSVLFQNNNLSKIGARTFYNLTKLISLTFSNNLISEIDSTAFTGCSVLKYLILDHNQLTKLSPRTFEDLNLDTLDLSFNQITELDGLTFNGLTVGSLNINNNNISNIVSGTFNNVNITKSLDLSFNQLTRLDNDTFLGLNQLININLSSNKISTIEAGAFNGMANVQSINLDGNNLSQLDSSTFAGLSNLQLISLYNNPNLQTSNLQSLCPTTAVNCIVKF